MMREATGSTGKLGDCNVWKTPERNLSGTVEVVDVKDTG